MLNKVNCGRVMILVFLIIPCVFSQTRFVNDNNVKYDTQYILYHCQLHPNPTQ